MLEEFNLLVKDRPSLNISGNSGFCANFRLSQITDQYLDDGGGGRLTLHLWEISGRENKCLSIYDRMNVVSDINQLD